MTFAGRARHEEEGGGERRAVPGGVRRGAYLVLATDIPHGERDVLVLDGLDVETCAIVEGDAVEVSGKEDPAVSSRWAPNTTRSNYRISLAIRRSTTRSRVGRGTYRWWGWW